MTVDLRVLPLTILVDEAWQTTRHSLRAVLLPTVLWVAPAALGIQVLLAWWNLGILDPGSAFDDRFCGTLVLGGVAMFALMVAYFLLYGAMMVAAAQAAAGQQVSWGAAFRFYLRPEVWGTDLVAWIAIFLGFLACLVPGIVLMAAWALRVPVMALENRTGGAALARSWELLRHHPDRRVLRHPILKALAVLVLGIVIGYAVALLIQTPATVVNQLVLFRDLAGGESPDPRGAVIATLWVTIPSGVLAAVAQLAVTLYLDFVIAHLYLDQRRRREGWDLELAIEQIAAGGDGSPA